LSKHKTHFPTYTFCIFKAGCQLAINSDHLAHVKQESRAIAKMTALYAI